MIPVLLSIKPEHAEKIFNGIKTYEFRRRFTTKEVNVAYIYASFPTKSVIGIIEIKQVLKMSPEKLWSLTQSKSGLTEKQFYHYFVDCDVAYAIEIVRAKRFEYPNDLSVYCIERPPQSYQFLYNVSPENLLYDQA